MTCSRGTTSAARARGKRHSLPSAPPELADVTTRVGKEIALTSTYHRVTIGPVSNDWDVAAIHDAMLRVFATFVVG